MFLFVFMFIGASEVIVIAFLVILLFGGRKIPELMKGLGKGVKEFNNAKKSITNIFDDETSEVKKDKESNNSNYSN